MTFHWATGIRAFILAIAWAGLVPAVEAKTPGEVGVGEPLRDTSMQGLSGPYRRLAEFRGKPLIINVWASWCEPCRREMASLDRLARRDNGRRFAVIGISTDDYPENARRFLAMAKTSFSHYIDNQLLLENMLGANRIPLTVLVDANGRVLEKHYGAKDWDSPEALSVVGKAFGFQP